MNKNDNCTWLQVLAGLQDCKPGITDIPQNSINKHYNVLGMNNRQMCFKAKLFQWQAGTHIIVTIIAVKALKQTLKKSWCRQPKNKIIRKLLCYNKLLIAYQRRSYCSKCVIMKDVN